MLLLASTAGDVAYYALAIFVAIGLGTAYMLVKLGGTFGRLSSSSPAPSATCCR